MYQVILLLFSYTSHISVLIILFRNNYPYPNSPHLGTPFFCVFECKYWVDKPSHPYVNIGLT